MAAPLLYALSESTGIGLSINRKTYLSMLASCLAIAFSILTNYLLVPKYEAAGAAVATAITFWFFFFLRTELSCLAWRRFKKYKIYTGSMLSTTTAVVVAIWGEYLGALSLLIWLVVGLLGCIIYRNSLLLVPGLCKSFFMAKNI
ncbi:MAG: polysaccharide biosynthesis C-terminal domain-containing protein [Gammaproteobacteria bacterium]|nr:polysaccharide biosynthesis C-terminal domain-containing protein [Gammaproteobacteria bacterium]